MDNQLKKSVNLNFPVDYDLWMKMKLTATQKGLSLRDFIATLLRQSMKAYPEPKQGKG
jgi:hypothetical protein